MSGLIAGMGVSFGLFSGATIYAIQNAAAFQTILIQMGRAGNLTQAQMQALGQTLMDVGGHSIFSIEELGQAFVTLLQRGVSANDIIHGVGQQATYLAEATGMQAVPAAQLLASTLVAFNIPASQAAKTVDLLQFAIEHGIGPADELQSALAKLGSISGILGISFDQIIPSLDLITRATGSYSLAATSLYYYLNQVKFGTATYRKEIESLGISFYDAQGQFIGLNNSLELLFSTLKDKSPKDQAAILGSLFNIRSSQGIGILMHDFPMLLGLTNQLAQSHDNLGVAMKRAQQAEDSAAGAWSGLRTNLQDVFTLMGGPFLAVIQPMLLHLRDLAAQLREFMSANPKVGATFLALGTAISGIALVVGIALSPIGAFVGIILAVVAGVVLLAAGLTWLVFHFQQIIAWAHPVIEVVQTWVQALPSKTRFNS
jgi:TP901 family phage tail tape measure protein